MKKHFNYLILFVFLFSQTTGHTALAQDPHEVQKLKNMIAILKIHPSYNLNKTNRKEYERQKKPIDEKLRKYFDFDSITEHALHERYQKGKSDSEKKKFKKTLQELIEAIAYAQVQKSLKNPNFNIQYSDQIEKEGCITKATATTLIKAETKDEDDMSYKIVFYFKNGLIYDLISYDEDNEPYFQFGDSLRGDITDFIEKKKVEKVNNPYEAVIERFNQTLTKVREGRYIFAD